jgi:acyl carrier protein
MTKKDFTREFAEVLNVDPERLTPETEMNSLEGWDSVTYLAAMVLIDEKLSVKIRPDVFSRAQTFSDILAAVGSALED